MHKIGNVLDKLPKGLQAKAKRALREIMYAETREDADELIDRFATVYGAKHPKAAACLVDDREALLTHFDFPAEHWLHRESGAFGGFTDTSPFWARHRIPCPHQLHHLLPKLLGTPDAS